ncbi:hypothetical protein AbraIFM66950_000479, partial [Aspergillus brasiliensis]
MPPEHSRPALKQSDVHDSDYTASNIQEPICDSAADAGYKVSDIGRFSPPKEFDIGSRKSDFLYASARSKSPRPHIEERLVSDSRAPGQTLAEAEHDRRTVSARKRLVDLLAENIHPDNPRPLQETDNPRADLYEQPDEVKDHNPGKASKADAPILSRLRGSGITYARQRSFLGNPLSLTAVEQRDTSAPISDPDDAGLAHIANNGANQHSVSDDEEIESRP